MTPKERVHAALRRQPVDRVPIFMWLHPQTAARLARLLEIPETAVAAAMGNDIRQAWVNNNHAMEGVVHERDGESHTDLWGIRWVKDGPFNQIAESPLASASPKEMRDYRFPLDHLDELMAPMGAVAAEAERYFVGCDVSPCVFEMYGRLRGMEGAMLDIAAEPSAAGDMLRRCGDFATALAEAACARFRLDWLWTGDDVGGQQAPLMAPETWRALVKPHLRRVVDVGNASGIWVAYHSCGEVRAIIGDLIDLGIDVLNPIQCNCPGMDPLELKREFGKNLAFMGGVDTQELLPKGTAAQVRSATRRLIDGMTGDGGGYILAASHTVPPETPEDNIFAMFAEAGVSREEITDRAADIRRRWAAAGADGPRAR